MCKTSLVGDVGRGIGVGIYDGCSGRDWRTCRICCSVYACRVVYDELLRLRLDHVNVCAVYSVSEFVSGCQHEAAKLTTDIHLLDLQRMECLYLFDQFATEHRILEVCTWEDS